MLKYDSLFANLKNSKSEFKIQVESYKNVQKVVDDSYFSPTSELVKKISGSRPLSDNEINVLYDYPKGFPTGQRIPKVPIDRSNQVQDIAELSYLINKDSEVVSDVVDSATQEVNAELKAQQFKIGLINNSNSSSNSTPSN